MAIYFVAYDILNQQGATAARGFGVLSIHGDPSTLDDAEAVMKGATDYAVQRSPGTSDRNICLTAINRLDAG